MRNKLSVAAIANFVFGSHFPRPYRSRHQHRIWYAGRKVDFWKTVDDYRTLSTFKVADVETSLTDFVFVEYVSCVQ